jgi:TusA-related sulfurtransferase
VENHEDVAGTPDEQAPARDDDGRLLVDARGMPCPRPVIELASAVTTIDVGDEVRLLADDPAAGVDVPVWCRMQRQALISQDVDGTALSFVVRKSRDI